MDQYHSSLFIIQLVGYFTTLWKWIQLLCVLLTTTFCLFIIVLFLLIFHLFSSSSCYSPFYVFSSYQSFPFHNIPLSFIPLTFPLVLILLLSHCCFFVIFEASSPSYHPFSSLSHVHFSDVLFLSPRRSCLNTEYTNLRSCPKRDSNPQPPIWRS